MTDLFYLGEFTTLLFLFGASQAALITGISVIVFPELGAIAYGVLSKPQGSWAKQPVLLVLTPTLAALIGVIIERYWGYSPLSVSLSIALALLVIVLLRSPIVPALAAGYLPVILGEDSFAYPIAVCVTISLLVLILIVLRPFYKPQLMDLPHQSVEELLKIDHVGLLSFIVFVLLMQVMVYFSGLKFILFPPLVVVSYEILTKPAHCPWAKQLIQLLFLTLAMVAVGLVSLHILGNHSPAILLTMVTGIVICRMVNMYLPPAMAIGLLPFVAPHPDSQLLISTAIGISIFIAYYFLYNHFVRKSTDAN
ncbi:HPP family protein [Ferrovum sp. JA12]|uniref:HPP family protein n=1 Tax=Ferrovum sp. JA12 TaxID=1356299 RepID=UPI0007030E4A|nr:HPP family protein [Ferrovum sp. JA12]KRH79102.1 HPP family protein [Ferrovum sp. JA12]